VVIDTCGERNKKKIQRDNSVGGRTWNNQNRNNNPHFFQRKAICSFLERKSTNKKKVQTTTITMPCGHLNAMRFAQKPLAQPGYVFVHVPKAKSSLAASVLQRIENREHFQTCMAEMLLLGKEAVRRRKDMAVDDKDLVVTDSAAKPLSLEYLADRLDIDDPCFGYLVRTMTDPTSSTSSTDTSASESKTEDTTVSTSTALTIPENVNHWNAGMLQGFITVTTFTNWQKTFRWDSLNPEAFNFDPPALTKQRRNGVRKWDSTGELSKALQATVHCGDVWNEGIVWPRIAEISLLGGLGCGRVRCFLCSSTIGLLL